MRGLSRPPVLRFVLRFGHRFVERMLGVHGFVHRLFELLMTVALVGHVVRLSMFVEFVSGVVRRVVPILAGPRWVLGHTEDASSHGSMDPCPSPLLHARRGYVAREMGRQPRD